MKRFPITTLIISMLAVGLQGQIYVHDFTVTADASNSNEATGATAEGSLTLNWDTMQIVVELTNLSGTEDYAPGDLTEFGFYDEGFDIDPTTFSYTIWDSDGVTDITGTKTWDYYDVINDLWNQNNDIYDGAAAENRGAGGDGLMAGQSGIFYFGIGSDALMAMGDVFVNNDNSIPDLFLRFQTTNPNGEGSDKVRVFFTNNTVPEPSTYGILGALLLAGLITYRRTRNL